MSIQFSWPKIGGLLAIVGGAFQGIPSMGGPAAFAWIGGALFAIGTGVIGLTARQNNQTSEMVGAAPKPCHGCSACKETS